jgi:hypothetical protein
MYVRIYFVLSEELHCHILGLFVTGKQRAGPEKLILFLFVQVERMLCMRVHNLNSNDIIITDSHSRLVNHHFVLMIFNFFKEFGSYLFHGQARVKTKIGEGFCRFNLQLLITNIFEYWVLQCLLYGHSLFWVEDQRPIQELDPFGFRVAKEGLYFLSCTFWEGFYVCPSILIFDLFNILLVWSSNHINYF